MSHISGELFKDRQAGKIRWSMSESAAEQTEIFDVSAGIVVSSGGEPLFHAYGFGAAIAATCGRAFKSVLQVCSPY